MKEITIVSGKGGTGKTSITAALMTLAGDAVVCDNDVDAADLHLLLNPEPFEEYFFEGAWQAEIDTAKCSQCGICMKKCRFDAISMNDAGEHFVNPLLCEGCRLCEKVCPENAISTHQSTDTSWYVSNTRFGQMVHANMAPGEENSGKLVTEIRKKAREIALEKNRNFVINDGPPGIGCTTISSVTGSDLIVMVLEPSKSGIHDAERLLRLVRSFGLMVCAVINKYDINIGVSHELEEFLAREDVQVLARLPFDRIMVDSLIMQQTIVEYAPDSVFARELKKVWTCINNEEKK